MHQLMTPSRFHVFYDRFFFILAGLMAAFWVVGIYYALFLSPPDYQQGEAVRIMYIHVPAAWMALAIYMFMAIAGGFYVIWKNPLMEVAALAAAPIGTAFTFICLLTGVLWGRPVWGAWWVWDARLTSVLILLFFYLGYMGLSRAFDESSHGAKIAAIFALVGVANIPIIKFSVDWWHTLHQPASILRSGGVAIHGSMLVPLLLMAVSFFLFFCVVCMINMKTQLIARKVLRYTQSISRIG